MTKGFTIDPDLREERNAACTDYESTMQWAMSNRPGAVPIGGGFKNRIAHWQRKNYARYEQSQRQLNRRFKLDRKQAPRAGVVAAGPSEKAQQRRNCSLLARRLI